MMIFQERRGFFRVTRENLWNFLWIMGLSFPEGFSITAEHCRWLISSYLQILSGDGLLLREVNAQ